MKQMLGLVPTVIATDGIAVIVNTNNAVDDLTARSSTNKSTLVKSLTGLKLALSNFSENS